MKILCSISGVEFTVEHFPATLYSREVQHPVFHLPQKKLLSYLGKWSAQELTPTDSYLLFLAILNSSDLVEFRVPAFRTELTNSIVAQHMEALAKVVSRINTITNPSIVFPHVAVTPDTKTLSQIGGWIESWQEAYQDYQEGSFREYDSRKLITRESALERLIKNPHLPVSAYSKQIAEWACVAGDFPEHTKLNPLTNTKMPCSEYWKMIIVRCSKEESIFSVPPSDISYLLTYCETNISIGTIYSNALFKVLRHAIQRQKNFLGFGDSDIGTPGAKGTYSILGESDTTESANIKAMIESAPDHEPTLAEYPNKLAYLKAKLRWQVSKKYSASSSSSSTSLSAN